MHRRLCGIGAAITAVACLTFAGTAGAAPTTFSGTVGNGTCDSSRTVPVSGPSRIEVQVSSTSGASNAFAEILRPDGSVAAEAAYDTPGAGNYSVRVCTYWDDENQPSMQYTAIYATGPAGQPAMPQPRQPQPETGGVLGAQTKLSRAVQGTGAIRTRAGLAYISIKPGSNGKATVKVYSPVTKKHYLYTNSAVAFGTNLVRIARGSMHLTLTQTGSREHLSIRSLHLTASGKVVKGSYLIV